MVFTHELRLNTGESGPDFYIYTPFHTCNTQQEISRIRRLHLCWKFSVYCVLKAIGGTWVEGVGGRMWHKEYAAVFCLQHIGDGYQLCNSYSFLVMSTLHLFRCIHNINRKLKKLEVATGKKKIVQSRFTPIPFHASRMIKASSTHQQHPHSPPLGFFWFLR